MLYIPGSAVWCGVFREGFVPYVQSMEKGIVVLLVCTLLLCSRKQKSVFKL